MARSSCSMTGSVTVAVPNVVCVAPLMSGPELCHTFSPSTVHIPGQVRCSFVIPPQLVKREVEDGTDHGNFHGRHSTRSSGPL